MDAINEDFEKCRICLELSDNVKNLFAQDCKYKFVIEDFIGIKLEEKVEYPSMICNKCVDTINILLEFKATCIKSQELLKNTEINLKDMIKTEVENAVNEIETFNETFPFELLDCSVTVAKDYIELNENNINDDSYEKIVERPKKVKRTLVQNELKRKLRQRKIIKSAKEDVIGSNDDKEWETEEDSNISKWRKKFKKSKKIKSKASVIKSVNTRTKEVKKSNEKSKIDESGIEKDQKKSKRLRKVSEKKNAESVDNKDQNVKEENQLQKKTTSTEPETLWQKYRKSYLVPCHICGKQYYKFRIQYHINTHLDVRPFVCEVEECKKSFPSPNLLKQHCRYCHSDYAPHKCEICGKAFKSNAALVVHKTYHRDPELPCSICGKLIRNRKTMKLHMFYHTGERPYKCDVCSKTFKHPSSLKTHTKIHKK